MDAQQTLLCAFLSGATFKKKKNPSREFSLTAKKILSEGSRFSFHTHCQRSLLSQLISQAFNQPACLEQRDFLLPQITWLHMGEKPFDEVNLQGSQILFILTVLSLLDSSPRDLVGLSPEGARKSDGTNPRDTQTHTDTASTPSPSHKLNIICTQDWGGSAKIIQPHPPSLARLDSEHPTVLIHPSPQT